jgi:hypothetical protein
MIEFEDGRLKRVDFKININRVMDFFKNKKRKKDEYVWVYECSLDPVYEKDFCIAEKGPLSEPYCKHGLKLVRVRKEEV